MVSGASGAARSQKAQSWKGPNTIGTRERAWQKRQKRLETSSAGRAGAHRPSEALHPTRSSDVLPRIARERVPTVPHVAKTRLLRRRYADPPTRFPCRRPILNATTSPLYERRYTRASSPRCFLYARVAALIQDHSV